MRAILLGLIVFECAALVAGVGVVVFGADALRKEPPDVAVFRPPVHDAVTGDFVRYQRRSLEDASRVLGYVDYRVMTAVEAKGQNLGRMLTVEMTVTDEKGGRKSRVMAVVPRAIDHGFLPPRFTEDDVHPMFRPVVKTIATTTVEVKREKRPGFLVEAIIPREDLQEVAHRYWFSDRVPVFGVARWERLPRGGRPGEVLVLHTMEKMKR